jgi:hypothetical protein
VYVQGRGCAQLIPMVWGTAGVEMWSALPKSRLSVRERTHWRGLPAGSNLAGAGAGAGAGANTAANATANAAAGASTCTTSNDTRARRVCRWGCDMLLPGLATSVTPGARRESACLRFLLLSIFGALAGAGRADLPPEAAEP